MTAAVLAREVMLLFVAGVAFYRWLRTRRIPVALVGIPTAAAVVWALYLRWALADLDRAGDVQSIGRPFVGIVDAFPIWRDNPLDLAVAAILIALLVVFSFQVMRLPSYLAWGAAGFVVLAVVLTKQVWVNSYDITRAVAPVLTAFVLTAFARGSSPTPSESPTA